jgi:nucleotide-binding universal stress UspA family protein
MPVIDWVEVEAQEGHLLTERLCPWSEAFPMVAVTPVVAMGRDVPVLMAESDGAQLVVVGARCRTGPFGVGTTAVSEELLRQAPCPIAIIRSTPAHTGQLPGDDLV